MRAPFRRGPNCSNSFLFSVRIRRLATMVRNTIRFTAMSSTSEQPHEEAFRQVLAHRTMLKAYVQAIVRDPSLAEDTFSDVTLEIARSWGRFDASRPFERWARGIARRVALANL